MTKFIEQTCIVKYRIPIKDDGTLGTPQLMSKFITEPEEQKKRTHKGKKKIVEAQSTIEEMEYM